MSDLRLLVLLFIFSQSVLFAQKDSTKKSFKPSGLIDAAPVAINKSDFKPQIVLRINAVDAITNLPVNARFDYYIEGDTVANTESGKVISLTIKGNEKIGIVANADGYLWKVQVFEAPLSDTSYVLKFERFKKGETITKQTSNLKLVGNFGAYGDIDILGLQVFLNLNKNAKVQISVCSEEKKKAIDFLMKKLEKGRICLKKCRYQGQTNLESITMKIMKA